MTAELQQPPPRPRRTSRAETAGKDYEVDYTFSAPGFDGAFPRTFRVHCSGAIIALNEFHRFMQNTVDRNSADRKQVYKPKLAPDEYTVIGFFHTYNDGIDGRGGKKVRSKIDYPNTPNPFVGKRPKEPKAETQTFGFLAEIPTQ